jgi:predicted DNA-binding transcriptional regulator AlpA
MDKLLTKIEVLQITGFSYPTLWTWMRQGRFPRSLVVGSGSAARVAWKESEIQLWLDNLPRSRFLGDPEPEQPKRHRRRLPVY